MVDKNTIKDMIEHFDGKKKELENSFQQITGAIHALGLVMEVLKEEETKPKKKTKPNKT